MKQKIIKLSKVPMLQIIIVIYKENNYLNPKLLILSKTELNS